MSSYGNDVLRNVIIGDSCFNIQNMTNHYSDTPADMLLLDTQPT